MSARLFTKGKARLATDSEVDQDVGFCQCVVMVGDREICECYVDGEPQTQEDAANARRIVECWNSYDNLVAQALQLKLQRDTLVELLHQAIQRKPMRADTYHAIVAALKSIHGADEQRKRRPS